MLKIAYSDGGDHQSLVLEALHNLWVGLREISREVNPVLQAPGPNLSENFYSKLRWNNTVYYYKMAWLIRVAAWLIECGVAHRVRRGSDSNASACCNPICNDFITACHFWHIAKYKLIDAVRQAQVRISALHLRGGPLPRGSHEGNKRVLDK